jgi:two-component system, cell cycle response regulator
LLRLLARKLQSHLGSAGTAYRMGGDEFCALIDLAQSSVEVVVAALVEHGEGFAIGCSYGSVLLPSEADDTHGALRIADERMYAQKRLARASASGEPQGVLPHSLAKRNPEFDKHLSDVADLAAATAATLSLSVEEVEQIRQAAELHDIAHVAIPDAILEKPAPLDDDEWAFVRRHTLIGERILGAGLDLRGVATLVRSSHENFDGTGYPDALAGQEIPLGSRIIAVCGAFDAMTTDRPYRRALDEESAIAVLRRCAGSQFDPVVVERFRGVVASRSTAERYAA